MFLEVGCWKSQQGRREVGQGWKAKVKGVRKPVPTVDNWCFISQDLWEMEWDTQLRLISAEGQGAGAFIYSLPFHYCLRTVFCRY